MSSNLRNRLLMQTLFTQWCVICDFELGAILVCGKRRIEDRKLGVEGGFEMHLAAEYRGLA